MKNITITIPFDVAVELMLLCENSKNTGNEQFDAAMKLVSDKIASKIE